MNPVDEIREKQKAIGDLAESIKLWSATPNAQKPEVQAKVDELQERLLFKLHKLEIQGMDAKVETMTEVLKALKGETA